MVAILTLVRYNLNECGFDLPEMLSISSCVFWPLAQNHSMGKVFSTKGVEKLDIHMQKNEVQPLFYSKYKN
jgi:hypothetical protein